MSVRAADGAGNVARLSRDRAGARMRRAFARRSWRAAGCSPRPARARRRRPGLAAPSLVVAGLVHHADLRGRAGERAARVFVTEKAGPGAADRRRRRAGDAVPGPDVEHLVHRQERGLLSIAFAPDYATSGQFYVYLTRSRRRARSRSGSTARSAANPNVADTAAGALLIAIPHTRRRQPQRRPVQFGPDGKLWLGDRRRRRRRQPVRPRPGPGLAARQAAAARPGRGRRR